MDLRTGLRTKSFGEPRHLKRGHLAETMRHPSRAGVQRHVGPCRRDSGLSLCVGSAISRPLAHPLRFACGLNGLTQHLREDYLVRC